MIFSEIPYSRIDMQALEAEWMTGVEAIRQAKSEEEAFYALYAHEKPLRLFVSMSVISEIRYTMDTNDAKYRQEEAFFDAAKPKFQQMMEERNDALLESKYCQALKTHLSDEWLNRLKLSKRVFSESIMEDLAEENRLSAEFTQLTANLSAQADGKKYTIAQLSSLANSSERSKRKKYSLLQEQAYSTVKEQLDELFDKLVKVRHSIAQKLGLNSFTDVGYCRMNRTGYGREQTEKFRNAVEKCIVPVAADIMEKQRQRLGVEELYYYDEPIDFPEGQLEALVKDEEILGVFSKIFSQMSPETHMLFEELLENECYDIALRDGKIMGAYSNFVPLVSQAFVFESFNNTPGAVRTFAHECGHALHSFLNAKEPLLANTECSMDLAEIHSMAMEFFIWPWLNRIYKPEDADKYKFFHIKNALTFIPYGCAVDSFQHEVYDNPDMSAVQRRELWKSLERRFLPWRRFDGDLFLGEGRRWQMQTHVYKWPFYYIDYALAQSCALEFHFMREQDAEKAWNSYKKLLKISAKHSFSEAINEAGLGSPFDTVHIERLSENVRRKLEIAEV